MHKLTIVGTAKIDFNSLIKEIAGVVECEFKSFDAALDTRTRRIHSHRYQLQ